MSKVYHKIGDEHVLVSLEYIQKEQQFMADELDEYYKGIVNDVSDEEYDRLRKITQQKRIEFWELVNEYDPQRIE